MISDPPTSTRSGPDSSFIFPRQATIKRNASRFILPAIIIFGAAIRFYGIGRESLWFDELYSVWSARLPVASLITENAAGGHPPLYYLAGHFWFTVFTSDIGVRLLSWVCGVGVLIMTYLLARRLFSQRVALLAAALGAVSPFMLWYSSEATAYAWIMLLSTASLYLLLRAIEKNGVAAWTLYTVVTAAVLFSYFFAPVLVVAEIFVFTLLRRDENGWRAFATAVGVLAIASVGVVALGLVGQSPGMVEFTNLQSFAGMFGRDIAWAPLFMGGGPAAVYYPLRGGLLAGLLAAPFVALALAAARGRRGAAESLRGLADRRLAALGAWCLTLVLGPIVLHAVMADDLTLPFRLYAWAAPALVIIAAVGLDRIPGRYAMSLAALVIAVTFFPGDRPTMQKKFWDMRGVMGTIAQNREDGDALLCFPLHSCVVANSQYPSGLTPAGGIINGGSVSLEDWTGYRDVNPADIRWLYGGDVTNALENKLAFHDRVWLVTGDGSRAEYPDAQAVYSALGPEWHVSASYDSFSPFRVTLYTRAPASG